MSKRGFVFALVAVTFSGCGGDAPPPTTPTVVATPTPAPTPAATPTPLASPTGKPMVRITARVLGFSRSGEVYNFVPTVFRPGDVIDLDCTPRDADNQATLNHPKGAEWYPSSNPGLTINRDFTMARDDTYQPELFLRTLATSGNITIFCKAQGVDISSNVVNLPVRGNGGT